MDEVEVALHQSVLARGAVNGDVSIVEDHSLAILADEREVVLVDGGHVAVFVFHVPVDALHVDDVNVVTFFVEE